MNGNILVPSYRVTDTDTYLKLDITSRLVFINHRFRKTFAHIKPEEKVLSVDELEKIVDAYKLKPDSLNSCYFFIPYFMFINKEKDLQTTLNTLANLSESTKNWGAFFELKGWYSFYRDDFKNAIKNLEQSLKYISSIQDRQYIFYKLAEAYYKIGSLQALHYLSIIKPHDQTLAANMSFLEGIIYSEIIGNRIKAKQYINTALDYFTRVDDSVSIANCQLYLAEISQKLGDQHKQKKLMGQVNKVLMVYKYLWDKETERSEYSREKKIHIKNLKFPVNPDYMNLFKNLSLVPLAEIEKQYIMHVLNQAVSLDDACKILNIDRKTLYNKRKSWDLV